MSLSKILHFYLTNLMCLLCFNTSLAEEFPENNPNESESIFEKGRSSISGQLFNLTDEIDALFNDARSIEQRTDDWIRLGAEVRFRESDALRFRQRIGAGFNLDQISKRLRLTIEAENGDAHEGNERVEDTPQADDYIRQTNREGGRGALRYFILKEEKYQLTADAGVRLSGGINTFASLRGNYWFEINDIWSMEPSQVFFVEQNEGFGGRSRLDFNRFLTKDSFLRLRNEIFRSEESRGFEFFEEISYLSRLSAFRSVSIPLALMAYSQPDPTIDVIRASIRYRTPLIRKWLYIIIEPGIDFPEERNYRTTPFLSLRFDALFDRRSALQSDDQISIR